jgi:hypothetical protein
LYAIVRVPTPNRTPYKVCGMGQTRAAAGSIRNNALMREENGKGSMRSKVPNVCALLPVIVVERVMRTRFLTMM